MAITLKHLKSVMMTTVPPGHRKTSGQGSKAIPTCGIPSPLFMHLDITPQNEYDEVLPGIFLGNKTLAMCIEQLQKVGITHVLNAAQGTKFNQIDTNDDYYKEVGIDFFGIEAVDIAGFKINTYFSDATGFISKALNNKGKVYIHCHQGLSRSAVILVAYMMLKLQTPLLDAMTAIRSKRVIHPNDGFLKQLIALNDELFPITVPESIPEEHIPCDDSTTTSAKSVDSEIENKNNVTDVSAIQAEESEESKESLGLYKQYNTFHKHIQETVGNENSTITEEVHNEIISCDKEAVSVISKQDNTSGENMLTDSKDQAKSSDVKAEQNIVPKAELVNNEDIGEVKSYRVDHIIQVLRDTKPETKINKNTRTKPKTLFANRYFSAIFPVNAYDEVYPGIFVGDRHLARIKEELQMLGITHIVNTAQGEEFTMIDTNQAYYADIQAQFHGIRARDVKNFKMLEHFEAAADFIEEALANGGKVYVHCHQGFSRSAAVTMAFLMLKRNMRLEEAIKAVRSKRAVMPNEGFIAQLILLDDKLFKKEK